MSATGPLAAHGLGSAGAHAASWLCGHEGLLVLAILPVLILPEYLYALLPVAVAVLALLLVAHLLERDSLRVGAPYDGLVLAILVLVMLAAAIAGDPPSTVPKAASSLAGLLVFWLCARRLQRSDGLAIAAAWLAVAGVGIAAASLIGTDWQPGKLFALWPVYDMLPRLVSNVPRSISGGFHPNGVGGALAIALPGATGLALYLLAAWPARDGKNEYPGLAASTAPSPHREKRERREDAEVAGQGLAASAAPSPHREKREGREDAEVAGRGLAAPAAPSPHREKREGREDAKAAGRGLVACAAPSPHREKREGTEDAEIAGQGLAASAAPSPHREKREGREHAEVAGRGLSASAAPSPHRGEGWGEGRSPLLPILIAGIVFMAAVLMLTQSRGGLVALGAGLIVMTLLLLPRRAARALLLAGVVIAIVAAGALLLESDAPGAAAPDAGAALSQPVTLLAHLTMLNGSAGDPGSTRLELWTNAVRVLLDYPLTGSGLNTFGDISRANYAYLWMPPAYPINHAHNVFLQAAADFGLPGLTVFLIFLLALARSLWQLSARVQGERPALLIAGLGGALAACVVNGLVDASARPLGGKPGLLFWVAAAGIVAAWRVLPSPQPSPWKGEGVESAPKQGSAIPATRRRWLALALGFLTLPLLVAAAQVNAASLALDRARRAPEGTQERIQRLQATLPLLERSSAIAGSWQSVRLGAVYLDLGRPDDALRAWRRSPAEATAFLWSAGDAHWLKREPAQAEPLYRMALGLSSDPRTMYRLGRALEDEGKTVEAMAAYRQALSLGDRRTDIDAEVDIHLRMARLLAEQQEWDAALDACDAGLSLDPHNGDLLVMWAGLIAQGQENTLLTETLLVAAIEESPGSLPVYKALFAEYMQAGQIAEAARLASSALAAVPGSAWPQIMLGRVALAKENPTEAMVRFRRARMMRPDLADPLIGTSEAHLLQGNLAAAIAQATLAVQVEPYRADAYAALGDAQRAAHDIPAARQAYRQALVLDAGDEEVASALASLSE